MEEEKELNDLKKQLEDCEKQKKEYLAGWQRSRADFINYKKEEAERIQEFTRWSTEEFILKILPILDDFELAEKSLPEDLKKDKFVRGLLQIKTHFQDFLKNQGVEEIKSMGEKFNPNFHEAAEEVEAEEKKSGVVLEEIQRGYLINGKLLRPAKVKLSK